MNLKLWPNLLSSTRIALVPAVLAAAIAGSQRWFTVLVVASLATDALDGYLARRLNAFTDFGRKLDSVADYLTMAAGLTGITLLWPDIVARELPWVVSGLGAFFAVMVYGFLRLGHAPCYHTWTTKMGVAGCALSLIPLLAGKTALPFHVAIVVLIAGALEAMFIVAVLPGHRGEVASLWHALARRRERTDVPHRAEHRASASAASK